jgi:hypothetical protein
MTTSATARKDREAADDPADDDQVQQLRDQVRVRKTIARPVKHLGAARPAKIEVAVINPHAQQKDLEETAPLIEPELEELLNHFAASREVLRCHAQSLPRILCTSCTRKTFAPAFPQQRSQRDRGRERSSIGSSRSLCRETICAKRRRRAADRARGDAQDCASNSRLCSSVFPNPIPGSNAMAMGSMPHSRARAYCCRKKSATSPTTSS